MNDPRPDIQINFSRSSSASFARDASTGAYTPGDCVGGVVMEFTLCARRAGGAGKVTATVLKKSRTGISNATFRLHLFTVAPTVVGDSGGFQTLWAIRANHVGYIDLVMTSEGGVSETPTAVSVVNLPFVCAADSTSLFGVLCAEAAYEPYALEEFFARLHVEAF